MSMRFNKFCISYGETLLSALKKIDENKKGFLLVIDEAKRVLGTLTDGDIRRAFINGTNINEEVANVYNKKFKRVFINDEFSKIVEYFKDNRIEFLPIVDMEDKLKNIITKNNMHVLLLEDIDFDLDYDFLSLAKICKNMKYIIDRGAFIKLHF